MYFQYNSEKKQVNNTKKKKQNQMIAKGISKYYK